jgi:glycosyltransferase involved in cell wall biosynthesis
MQEQITLPYYEGKIKPDLIHYPNFNVPFFNHRPFVMTLCDLIYFLYPEACPNTLAQLYAKFFMRFAAKKALAIITISHFSKREIMRHLKVPESKIHVTYCGIDRKFKPTECPVSLKQKYSLPDKYVLYVGNHQPLKNLQGLIKGFAQCQSKGNYFLVIGGKKDPRRTETYNLIREHSLEDRVIFSGFIQSEDLPAIYSAASLFVFPSYYEGFGLPPLEAMACGTPVICSNTSSFPETVGDAAIMVSPGDTILLSKEIDRILADKELQKDMIEKGLQQVKKFSWDETAAQTIEIYSSIFNKISEKEKL